MFSTIENHVETEIIEKKSRFIANIFYVESEEAAKEKILQIKKKYHDARHNTYAYRIKQEKGTITKQSDDGEPAGTAGLPILNVLEKKDLLNIVVIVTRYFGGILLGTGGLVKAYSEATIKAVEKSNIVQKEEGYVVQIEVDYSEIQNFEYVCMKNNVEIVNADYAEKVNFTIEIAKEEYKKIIEEKFNKFPSKILETKYIIKCRNIKIDEKL